LLYMREMSSFLSLPSSKWISPKDDIEQNILSHYNIKQILFYNNLN
jgi:hypothetical protein